jgi:hypothetical protein
MMRVITSLLLIAVVWVACLVIGEPTAVAKCVEGSGITACPGAHEIDLGGHRDSKGGQGSEATNSIGAVQSVICGPSAAAELAAAGDTNASEDVITCQTGQIGCAVARVGAKQRQVAAVRIRKQADGTWAYDSTGCLVIGPAVVTAAMVRDRVVRLVPSAAVGLAPQGATLVNIETVMWVNAPQQRTLAPIALLGRRVVVALAIDHVDWSFGDGTTDSTASAGKAYDAAADPCRAAQCPSYYGHTYRQTGSRSVSATASWQVTFTVDGGAATAIPGTVAGPTAQTPVVVKQARAVLVPNPGDR